MVTMRAGTSISTSVSQRMRWLILALCLLLWPALASAQGTIAPVAHQVFLSNAGAPLNNAKICTYSAGTTTPLSTYSNEALTVALPNPIRTNSAGRPQNASGTETNVYWSAASYRVDILTAGSDATCATGTTIYSADNVPAIPALAAALDVTGTAGATILAGEVVYLSDGSASCGATAGSWYLADADATCSSSTAGRVGVAPTGIATGVSGSIRLQGRITGLSALTAGDKYYVSATAGALTATPPTNARFIASADSTTTIVVGGNPGSVLLPDTNGTHDFVLRIASNLTADRIGTIAPGDAAARLALERFRPPQGRCTLTSAVPVTVSDVTAATTLYYALYGGNNITLYDGSAQWVDGTFAQLSIAVPATTNTMYDVFVDYTAGVPALEVVAWTNDTTRATPLALQDGVYVQTSDTDSLYVCSFRTTGVAGQTEDSFASRFVWNYYNRQGRAMRRLEPTDTWTYTTATFRQANGSTANQLAFVIGVAEVLLEAEVLVNASNDGAGRDLVVGIGLDSTTAIATGSLVARVPTYIAGYRQTLHAILRTFPSAGYHYAAWLEYSDAAGITTWVGDGGLPLLIQSGITGSIEG